MQEDGRLLENNVIIWINGFISREIGTLVATEGFEVYAKGCHSM